ncbi:aminopeptidase N [Thermopetrobacter sp. TC1]|uniref:aminopeptidase N n=1 Tax=Thermopetrobacter sp. TC1 TaxID=1495045 RepID=UPI00056F7BF2|nr:aminopeptidase N [Thermopetrobacter sp. TC1]
MSAAPKRIHLSDYAPPEWLIDNVALTFDLHPQHTEVSARLQVRRNPACMKEGGNALPPLRLDGEALELVDVRIGEEERPLDARAHVVRDDALIITRPPAERFTLHTRVRINPAANTQLSGLYMSNGIYCTQCEAEGFRRITYWPDRPDVLSRFTVRIQADEKEVPVLLSNGNPVESGRMDDGRHYAVWQDPYPKPSYLFALVAGRLEALKDTFTTADGRTVDLAIWVEPGKAARARFALESLKKAMRWDEERFGRVYDLDVFNIVAVPDFNMGAMENKGLNIFNDRYILADENTATDRDYENIEAIIAHEYFHNWTGNRITCRDWFQLCLKEGLTVFRDQEFTSDVRSRAVKRIEDVRLLRSLQFPEDAGPLAHPVRPSSFGAIDNLYTVTVYEKGAEIVRMMHTLLGEAAFRKGMDVYFERFDGQAVTVEDFIAALSEGGGRDLSAFMRWYEQAGTPHVTMRRSHDDEGRLTLHLVQNNPKAQEAKPEKALPQPIPLRLALFDKEGKRLPLRPVGEGARHVTGAAGDILLLDSTALEITFDDVPRDAVVSLNRGFSAPIRLESDLDRDTLLFLLKHDDDAFNRWEAGQTLAVSAILDHLRGKTDDALSLIDAMAEALLPDLPRLANADPAFLAEIMKFPGVQDLAVHVGRDVDPEALHLSREAVMAHFARRLGESLPELFSQLAVTEPYAPTPEQCGRRAAQAVMLALFVQADAARGAALAMEVFRTARNMTETALALDALNLTQTPQRDEALAEFRERFGHEPLLLDKWLAWHARWTGEGCAARLWALTEDEAFTWRNPNRVRSLFGVFGMANPVRFHAADGSGYALLARAVRKVDALNPQTAARLAQAFGNWRVMEPQRRKKAEETLKGLAEDDALSADVRDIVERALSG